MRLLRVSGTVGLLLWQLGSCSLAADPKSSKAVLRCGPTIFTARTRFRFLATLSQGILAFRVGKSPIKVELRETLLSLPSDPHATRQLASNVSAWQCRSTPIGPVLVLAYSCNLGIPAKDMERYCTVTHEWVRYVASDGKLLDAGFTLEDPRYEALRASMGYHDKPDQAFDEGPFIEID